MSHLSYVFSEDYCRQKLATYVLSHDLTTNGVSGARKKRL